MSDINQLLSSLQKTRKLGQGKWIACCPVHQDKSPSLAITQKPDGGVLIHCFSCHANGLAVCSALGVDPSTLFPRVDNPRYEKQSCSGFSAWQLMYALKDDLIRLLVVANSMKAVNALSNEDRDFVSSLVIRINEGIGQLEGTHQ